MSTPVLATKVYLPPPRPRVVPRPRLSERLDEGLRGKLTLVSAPAGFGKTTLVGEWVAGCGCPAAWLSLDEGDNDSTRFLTYLVTALQTVAENVGEGVLGALGSPQPPPVEAILAALINEITTVGEDFVLVLDDYHRLDAEQVDSALAFLIEHLPPRMHLLIATREDPRLPLARLRARGQLTELRAADLRFTPGETAEFLERIMGLDLSAGEIAALENRTEGWIAGLQMAALSMQGRRDVGGFIESFAGSHRFVLDYLVEEVLQRQPENVQAFLLRTSILERMCGSLCDAVLLDHSVSGQQTLEYLERANLFVVPLDDERRWYRYHHLFAGLLRQRLPGSAGPPGAGKGVAELHVRASQWYEDNGLEIEAFHHAAAAKDAERAARLVEGGGMPLIFRGAALPVLSWLESLPRPELDRRPSLWVIYASALLFASRTADVEPKLRAAEAALHDAAPDDETRDLVGHIASIRATLAVTQHQVETIVAQSRRALEYLRPDNLPVRTATTWTLGHAYHLQGDRAAAGRAYEEAVSTSERIGHTIITIMASTGLGNVQEAENQLHPAARTYRRVLEVAGDPPPPVACEAHLGLARISYEWNDLDAAEHHGQLSLQLARQLENTIDRSVACEVFLARLELARGDVAAAAAILNAADQTTRQHGFVHRISEVAAARVLLSLRRGDTESAARLARTHELPASQARVHLFRGEASEALAVLEPLLHQVQEKGWEDERLKVTVLQALTHHARGEGDRAAQLLGDALASTEPGGLVRVFVDEGKPMERLLRRAAAYGITPDYTDYTDRLLAAFGAEEQESEESHPPPDQLLVEPLSYRELEILRLVAQGLSNREIGERLFLAVITVKGHNRNIFRKLGVRRRTEAVTRAREIGLL